MTKRTGAPRQSQTVTQGNSAATGSDTAGRALTVTRRDADPVILFVPRPVAGDGQVLVRMRAAALNFADLLALRGTYQATPPCPYVPGMEGAGEIAALGAGVDPALGLGVGQRVGVAAQGTLADWGVFDAAACTPIPDSMPWPQAAGFQIAYGTSHLALTRSAHLQRGETLVVLGAAGGVGLTAVEIGAALGARVIAVARGADRLDVARAAGATDLVDSATTDDLRGALRALGGCDVVYDAVGDAPGLAAFGALRPGGRFLLIGFAGGKPPALPLNHALVKNIAVLGFYWGGLRALDPVAFRTGMDDLFALYRAGKLHPHVGATFPLERIDDALAMLRQRRAVGKVVITL